MFCFPVVDWVDNAMQSVTYSKFILQRCVYIASDGGRVCRPLVIADKGVSRIKEHHMKELKVFFLIGFEYLTLVFGFFTLLNYCFLLGWCPQFRQFLEGGFDRVS